MINYELINYCEFDKYAKKSYSIIHNEPENKNIGDITLVNEKEIADFNMMVGGSPCQDFSVAGQQKGAVWTCKNCKDENGDDYQYNPLEVHYTKRDKCPKCESANIEKTRSSLVVEWLRILHEKKPNLAIYENVKNLVGKKHKHFFDLFINELHEYGYNTYYKVLNAKDYGVPQNRERVYLIIIKKELDNGNFKFPEGFDNGIRLKDVLEKEVDEKYYISQEKTNKLIEQLKTKNKLYENEEPIIVQKCGDRGTNNYSVKEISNTIPSNPMSDRGQLLVESKLLQVGNIYPSKGQNGNVYDTDGISPTISSGETSTKGNGGIGSNNAPKILQVGCIEGKNFNQNKVVYDINGIAPTIQGQGHCGNEPKILEENKVIQVGNIVDTGNWDNPQRGRIYSPDGCSPALNTCGGGGLEPKILEDFYANRDVREYDDYSPTLRADRQGLKVVQGCATRTRNYIGQSEQLEVRDDELSNSITTVQKDSMAFEINSIESPVPELVGGIGEINFGKQYRQGNRVYNADKTAMCLLSQPVGNTGGNSYLYLVQDDKDAIENISSEYQFAKDKCMEFYNKNGYLPEMFNPYNQAEITNVAPTQTTSCNRSCSSATVLIKDIWYRIRKLIPLECFRLMGFNDEDFYILKENGISDSQCYKMAGNSIVTDVLYYILLEIHKAMPYLLEDIKLSSFFSGIGAFEKAIKRLQETVQ